jgi:Flp pilus assembly protein TadD
VSEAWEESVPRLLLELGYWCIRNGQPADAQVLLRGARAWRPSDPTPAMFLGMADFAAGRYPEAERAYRDILEKHDDDLTRAFLAESLIAQKRWNEATTLLESVVQKDRQPAATTFARELLQQLKNGLFQRRS